MKSLARWVLMMTMSAAPSLLLACGSGGTDHPRLDVLAEGAGGSGVTGDAGGSGGAGAVGGSSAKLHIDRSVIVSRPSTGLYESEPHLARGPDGELAAVFIALGAGRSIGVTTSLDDGATWTPPLALAAPGGREGVDPSVAFDASGALEVAFLGLRYDAAGEKSDRQILVARAPSVSSPFAAPISVTGPGTDVDLDKPWILPLADGASLIAWTTETGSPVTVARSDDGASWKQTTIAPDGSLRGLAFPCAASATLVHVVYLTPSGVFLGSSTDGGKSFPAALAARVSGTSEQVAFDPPSCVASGDSLWVAYGLLGEAGSVTVADQSAELRVARSLNQGVSFGPSHRVAGPGAFLHPQLARDDSGRLAIVVDARGDGAGAGGAANAFVRALVSTDDGVTFASAGELTGPMAFDRSRTDLGWLGDYVGVTLTGGELRAVVVDNAPEGGGTLSRVRFVAAALP